MNNMENIDVEALYTSSTEKTFQYENELPSLPVPSLQHTLDRYLDSVKPHVSDEEYRQTEFIVQQFASGVGKDLHKKLQERAATHRNWETHGNALYCSFYLSEWWSQYGYLDFRLPLSPLLNFAGPGPYMHTYLPAKEGSQIKTAGLITYYVAGHWAMLRKERLRPDKDSKGTHLAMRQYHHAFSTCRIPSVKRDQLKYYFKTEAEGAAPMHLIVLCRGRIFSMRGLDDNEEPLTAPELQAQFQLIRDKCDREPAGPAIGSLTGDNRTSWAQMRSRLVALHPQNSANLEEIQSSMFCVALDDSSPKDENEVFKSGLAGDCTNRWFDKSLTLIYHKNGLVASNCDHSPYDAMVLVSCVFYCDLCISKTKGKWLGSQEIRKLDPPRELVFVLDDVLYKGIDNARQVYNMFASNLNVCTKEFKDYGKKYLRKYKLHPDSHVQMALQLAYYKMHNKPAPTYETATTRKFFNSRTETMRSCTNEALDWSKAMCNHRTQIQEKHHLYMRAINRHNKLMAEAQSSNGCDRHLFGLQILALESGMPMPQLYTDPSYTKSGGGGNFVLSTSFVGYTTVYGGVVPMVEHGYGSFYKIEQEKITVVVSSWNSCEETDATKFRDTLQECLREMATVIEAGLGKPARL